MNWIRIIAAVCLLLPAACSNYDARWKKARETRVKGDPFAGAYEGGWKSARYDAGGKLWCILSKKSSREYLAEFRATWHGIFSSCHTVMLKTSGKDGKALQFTGEAAISMWIGSGTYRCDGTMVPGKIVDCTGQIMTGDAPRTLVPARITAKYDATYDAGTMELTKRSD